LSAISRPPKLARRNFFRLIFSCPRAVFVDRCLFAFDFARRFAFRVILAGEKLTETPEFDDHRRAARLADFVGRDRGFLFVFETRFGVFQINRKFIVKSRAKRRAS
jgi:hypothetical protein